MNAITIALIVFAAALALCIAIASWLHARRLTPAEHMARLEARNLRQRQALLAPKALPSVDVKHTALDATPLPWARSSHMATLPPTPRRVRPAPAPMNDRIRQRIAHCATVRAHEDHFNGITTDCPLTGDDEAAAIWSRAYAVALQRIADLRELHNVPPTPAARPTAHVQRAEAELFGRQYAPMDLAPA